jgi:methylase of polypeptide subunit release factors
LTRINHIGDSVFITDGPWMQHRANAVYPFEDEATILLRHAQETAHCDAVVDLATGCGHSAIAHPCIDKYALDINARARRFVILNAELNSASVRFWKRDLRDGLPTSLLRRLSTKTHVLFLANMPFAVSPHPHALPRAADGGRNGNDLTLAAVQALGAFEGQGTALMLTNSLYNSRDKTWQIMDSIEKRFPDIDVQWQLVPEVRVWRVNGERSEPNPMCIRDGLPLKAECQINVADSERLRVRKQYRLLARQLEREGWDELGCGLLMIPLNS